ncbi:MAG: hypothetical protein WC043_10635 [Pseudobdellovibrionaceae bacterium]
MIWFLWAVLGSVFAAALSESNRILRFDAQILNAWRATFGAVLLALAIPYMQWPTDRFFYIVAGLDGIVAGIGMVFFFILSARKTGRVSSMILPMAAISAYLTWWMMHPELRPELVDNPFQVLVACVSMTIVCVAMQLLRENDASLESFLIVLPVGISFGIIDSLTKGVFLEHDLIGMALSYSFVAMCCCALTSWLAVIPEPLGGRRNKIVDPKMFTGAFWCAFFTVGITVAEVMALRIAPNPALPGILMVLTPLWLFGFNFLRKVEDDVSLTASILILVGAVGLLLSTF